MDCALYASLYDLVNDKCSMSRVCENAFMSMNPHDCNATLHESFNVVDIPNDKLLKKKAVEDNFFTPHGFISLATRTMSTLSWIFGKSLLKPKRAHIHTKKRQSPWFKLMAHHFIFWLMIQAHESHRGNFGSRGLEDQEVCSVKFQWFKVDKGKHVAWRVFSNSLNSDRSVCNR